MSTNARIVGQQSLNRFVVELSYSGRSVPEGLMGELASIGWRVPPVPPRPASAIDWDTPDPAAGTPYSIGEWRVEGVALGAPTGSGIGGRWTDEERVRYLSAIRAVFRSHPVTLEEIDVEPDVNGTGVSSTPSDTAAPAPMVPSGVDGPSVGLFAVLAPDRAGVLGALCESIGQPYLSYRAVVAASAEVGAAPETAARSSVGWLEARLTPEQLDSASGSTLISSPLFRHGLWLCHAPSVLGDVARQGLTLVRAIVADADATFVRDGVRSMCGADLGIETLQSNGRNTDVLLEGGVEPMLFDAVCAEIVRISPESVCRGAVT